MANSKIEGGGEEPSTHRHDQAPHSKRELKPWEAEEKAERLEVELEIVVAQAKQSTALHDARKTLNAHAQTRDAARAATVQARKVLKQAHEAVRHLTDQLNTMVGKIDPEKDDVATLTQKLADLDKQLADLKAKHDGLHDLKANVETAETAEKAADADFRDTEPTAKATYEVACAKAESDFAKADAASRRKLSDIKKKFADRIDEI